MLKDNLTRTENHIIIYVQELKNIQTKKKYFCEICLDKKLCAKTTAKVNNDRLANVCKNIFWNLIAVSLIKNYI